MKILLSALAEQLGLVFHGPDVEITGVNTLEKAGPSEISFLVNSKYVKQLEQTRAGCVLASGSYVEKLECALVSENVYMDLARILELFSKKQGCVSGISNLAFIHETAQIDPTATVYPFAFIGADVTVGAETVIFSGCYIGEDTSIGDFCTIYPNAVVMGGGEIGDDVIIQPGAVLGGDGYGYAQTPLGHMKIPQIGNVVIEDNVEIGSNTAIDRAALDTTRIGMGTKIDNLVQIGHNVQVGQNCLIVGQAGVGGSSQIGNGVVLAGQVGVADNLKIGDGVMVAAQSGVTKNIDPGTKLAGSPAIPAGTFLKAVGSCIPRLPDLLKRVKKLEKELEALRETHAKGDANES